MKRSDLATLRTAISTVLSGGKYYGQVSSRLLVENMVDEGGSVAINLTSREREVLRGFADGENTKALAERLGVGSKTVHNHLALLKKN